MPIFTLAGNYVAGTILALEAGTAGYYIASSIVAAGLAVGVGKLTGVFDAPNVSATDQGVEQRIGANPLNRVPVLYGNWMQRGIVTFAEVSSDRQELRTVLTLGEGEATSIDSIYWNDLLLSFDSDGVVNGATDPDGNSVDRLNGLVTIQTYLGGSNNRSTYLEGLTDSWTSDHKMTGLVYAVINVKYNRDQQVTGLPDMRFVGTSPNSNPSDAVLDQLQNSVYGLGLSDDFIDTTSFTSAETYFDELVEYRDSDDVLQMAKRFEVNGSLNTADSVLDRIETILRGSNSSLRWSNGKFAIFVNKADTEHTFTFDDSNIIGDIDIAETGFNNLINKLVITYGRDANNNWQRNTTYLESPDSVRYPNEIDREVTLDLPLVATNIEAERVGAIILNQSRQQLAIKHKADATAMSIEAGDVVRYTDADFGWDEKRFRVISITEIDDNSGALTYDIEAVEYAADIYDDSVLNEIDVSPNTNINDPAVINAVTDLDIENVMPTGNPPRFDLTWTNPSVGFITQYDVYYGDTTTFDDAIFLRRVRKPGGVPFSVGASETESITSISAGTWYFWIVARNERGASGESNTATLSNWSPVTIDTGIFETAYRFNEQPAVVDGANIDIGAPPANATGTGHGRNDTSEQYLEWYEADPETLSNRENAPVWTAVTEIERTGGEPRIIDFTVSGTAGDEEVVTTEVAQVIDFELSGTVGNRELQYNARPSIDDFTFTGQAAESGSFDTGIEEVWQITASGTTDGTQSDTSEEFYIYPQGTSGTFTNEQFIFTPSGNTSDGADETESFGSLSFAPGAVDQPNEFELLVNGTSVGDGESFNNVTNFTSTTNIRIRLSEANTQTLAEFFGQDADDGSVVPSNSDVSWELTDGSATFSADSSNIAQLFDSLTQTRLYIYRDGGSVAGTVNGTFNFGGTWTLTLTDSAVGSSVSITLDDTTNSYDLADNLSGGAAIGAALNTAIGTDFDSDWTKTFDSSTGVITFTADDFDDHTGNAVTTQGTNGNFTITTTNNDTSGNQTTVQVVIATESIDETFSIPSNITGTALFNNLLSQIQNNTAITDEFTVESSTETIPEHGSVTVIKLTANDNTNHTLNVTISNGLTNTASGSLVEGGAATSPTTIRIDYDADLNPVQQNITFGANTTSQDVAAELASEINMHGDIQSVQGRSFYYSEFEDIASSSPILGVVRLASDDLDNTDGNDPGSFEFATDDEDPENITEIILRHDRDFILAEFVSGNYLVLRGNSESIYGIYEIDSVSQTSPSIYAATVSLLASSGTNIENNGTSLYITSNLEVAQQLATILQKVLNITSTVDDTPDLETEIYYEQQNATDFSGITSVRVHDSLGSDFTKIHLMFGDADLVDIAEGVYSVTSNTDNGGYRTLSLNLETSVGTFPTNYTSSSFALFAISSENRDFTYVSTATTLYENTGLSRVVLKPDIVGNQAQPTVTITQQGTGDASFSVLTLLEGRSNASDNSSPSAYTVLLNGARQASESFASASSNTEAANAVSTVINNTVDGFSSTVSSGVVRVTSDTNTDDRLTISITTGTNDSDATSPNDLAVSREAVNFGSDTDVFAGADSVINVLIGGDTYYTGTYDTETIDDIIDDLETNIDAINTDFPDRFSATQTQSDTIRATAANFVGTTPTMTWNVSAGSTASTDSIGNITTTAATLSAARTVVNDGEEQVVTGGEFSNFTVTQGTDTLIDAQDISGAADSATSAQEILQAINNLSPASEYSVTRSGSVLTATLDTQNNTPDLTISISPGLNDDDTAANLAISKNVTQQGMVGSIDLTDAVWDYFISGATVDDDLVEMDSMGVITLRRGAVLDTTSISANTQTYEQKGVVGDTSHTTSDRDNTLVLSGSVQMPGVTQATSDTIGYTLEYATGDTVVAPDETFVNRTYGGNDSIALFINNSAITGTLDSTYVMNEEGDDYIRVDIDAEGFGATAIRNYLGITAASGYQDLDSDITISLTNGTNSLVAPGISRVQHEANSNVFQFGTNPPETVTVTCSGSATDNSTGWTLVIERDDASTWTELVESFDYNIGFPGFTGQLQPVPFNLSHSFDADPNTTYHFRVFRRGNDTVYGISFGIIVIEELRAN